jgi:hypothetical protein
MSIDIGFVTEAAGCNSAIELITSALKPTYLQSEQTSNDQFHEKDR